MKVHQNISINKVYAKNIGLHRTAYAHMPIYVDRSNAGSCIYLVSLFVVDAESSYAVIHVYAVNLTI